MKPASKKRISTQLRQLNKMLWVAFPLLSLSFYAQAENTTPFSDSSLTGIQRTYGPNIALALSVEYPTAGAAYSSGNTFTSAMLSQNFLGYFDNTKCYEYRSPGDRDGMKAFTASGYSQFAGSDNTLDTNYKPVYAPDGTRPLAGKTRPTDANLVPSHYRNLNSIYNQAIDKEFWVFNGSQNSTTTDRTYVTDEKEYFVPTRKAESRNGMVGICDGANEFSGNFMNWATMTAIDVFRQAMTGGNRAIGIKNDRDAYTSGDTATQTFLRRANIVRLQNRNNMIREADLTDAEIKLVLPHDYASDVTNPTLISGG